MREWAPHGSILQNWLPENVTTLRLMCPVNRLPFQQLCNAGLRHSCLPAISSVKSGFDGAYLIGTQSSFLMAGLLVASKQKRRPEYAVTAFLIHGAARLRSFPSFSEVELHSVFLVEFP
jgi:hypothetical protein